MESKQKKFVSQHSLTIQESIETKDQMPKAIPLSPNGGEDISDEEVPDVELLEFQKKRSTPLFRLSSVAIDQEEEELLCEVQDFSKIEDKVAQVGLLPAGVEDQIGLEALRQLSTRSASPK